MTQTQATCCGFGERAELIPRHSEGLSNSDSLNEDTLATVLKSVNQRAPSEVRS